MRYWEKRAREWQKARDKKSAKLNADLVKAYRKAAEELQKEIFAWYEKYATADGVTLADAKKALSTDELKKLKGDLETFEKLAKENGKHTHDKVLTKMSAAVHVSRLESLQLQMRCILYELYKGVDDELTDTLKSFYADERERMAYETQLARGEFEQIATTDEKRIERVLKTPWATDGKDFSSRLWTNREQLVGTLQAEITRALITGDDSASVGKAIAKKLNASLYAASRVAQTEITRVTTESDKDTFAEMDVEEVEVVGTLDLHTCGTCGDMDGKHMPRAEAHAGTTAPPFHPNCRCVIVPYFGDEEAIGRAMRDPVTGKTKIDAAMSFQKWKEVYGVNGRLKDTTKQYSHSSSQKGEVIKPEGYTESKHTEEIKIAEWLKSKIGGKIELLKESMEYGVKTSDYRIDGYDWELKTISTEKAADSAVRKGLKQIKENPGGIILQLGETNSFDVKLLGRIVSNRLRRSSSFDVTVLIVKDGEILKSIKCKK